MEGAEISANDVYNNYIHAANGVLTEYSLGIKIRELFPGVVRRRRQISFQRGIMEFTE